jgi:hypothetical protein
LQPSEILSQAGQSAVQDGKPSERCKGVSCYVAGHASPPISAKPPIAAECDSASSLIMEVESGGIALLTTVFKRVAGKRLLFRPLTGVTVSLISDFCHLTSDSMFARSVA